MISKEISNNHILEKHHCLNINPMKIKAITSFTGIYLKKFNQEKINQVECFNHQTSAVLATGTKYTLALHTGSITDNAGNQVASAVHYFTTEIQKNITPPYFFYFFRNVLRNNIPI